MEDPQAVALQNVVRASDGTFAIPTDSHEEFVSRFRESIAKRESLSNDGSDDVPGPQGAGSRPRPDNRSILSDHVTHDVYDMHYVIRSAGQSIDLDSEVHEFGGVKRIVETFARQIGEPDSVKKVFCTGQFWCILEEIEIYADELQERLSEPNVPTMPRYVSFVPQVASEQYVDAGGDRLPSIVEVGASNQLRYYGNKVELRPHKTILRPFAEFGGDVGDRSPSMAELYGQRGRQPGGAGYYDPEQLEEMYYAGRRSLSPGPTVGDHFYYQHDNEQGANRHFIDPSRNIGGSGSPVMFPELARRQKKQKRRTPRRARLANPFSSSMPFFQTSLPLMPLVRSMSTEPRQPVRKS